MFSYFETSDRKFNWKVFKEQSFAPLAYFYEILGKFTQECFSETEKAYSSEARHRLSWTDITLHALRFLEKRLPLTFHILKVSLRDLWELTQQVFI